jgi:steroid 5-alpha reductase family enzyme
MLAVVAMLIATPRVSSFAIGNLAMQAVLFTAVAAIPALLSGKMSYVDIAWPWGLVAIGLQVPVYAPGLGPAAVAISVVYVAVGLRMGGPALLYLARVGRLKAEFHRYRYQRIRWAAAGWRGERMPMQLEIYLQGLASASVLAVPALLVASDRDQRLDAFRLTALVMWAGCWSLEWWADRQKRRSGARADRTATCDVGLWRYSRHPNYFFQWMGWNAVALAAAPGAGALILPLLGAPAFMLWTLVHLTGIKPSEYYSVRKRPAYGEYQRTTNSFVPGPRRAAGRAGLAREG